MIPSGGKYVRMGNKYGTCYEESGDALYDLIDDYYGIQIGISKSAGAATYGDNGYFNAIMGKEITAAMFSSDNVFAAIGARPYQHEGVRIADKLATYGKNKQGKFVGLGAGTVQDGKVPASVKMPVQEIRQPYKDLPFSFDYGLGLQALESKDDTIAYKDYVKMMTANYSDLADKTILRPMHEEQPLDEETQSIETSLNSIARVIGSHVEIGKMEHDVEISDGMASPYGGLGANKGDMFRFRAGGRSNFDGKVVNANKATLTIDMMKKLWRTCSVNWTDSASPNNKVWMMGNIAQDLLAAQMAATNIYTNSVFVQRSFNGVKTIPGRDAGFLMNAFQNIPIIQDGNINFDYDLEDVSDVDLGDIYLLDLNHIWLSMLTPVEMFNINNPAITRNLQEANTMNMRAELRIDSFIQHGRIIGLGQDA